MCQIANFPWTFLYVKGEFVEGTRGLETANGSPGHDAIREGDDGE